MIKNLIWTDTRKPNDGCPYDHVISETPFGKFLITWKGWKENDCPIIDETPWGGYGGAGVDLEETKEIAETEYKKRINECLMG